MRSRSTSWLAPSSALSRPRFCPITPIATCRANTTASDGAAGEPGLRPVRAPLWFVRLVPMLLVTVLLAPSFLGAAAVSAQPPPPPSAEEIGTAMRVLRAAGHADTATRFPLITLDEPDKEAV